MDKFPEAFRRFEQVRNIDRYDNYSDILREFESWQNAGATDLQARALAQNITKTVKASWYKQQIKYHYGFRTIFRDRVSGKFVRPR
jgi:hypothetical protein